MSDRFDIGIDIVCIKPYETLVPGESYHIGGCGDLTYAHLSPKKSGYGFSIRDDKSKNHPVYYFTITEIDNYFMTSGEYYPIFIRDQKLKNILE